MTLTATNQVNSPFAPGVSSEIFIPDQLIAGNLKLVTQNYIVASGAGVVTRGTPMGVVTATGKVIPSVSTAVDGSEKPVGLLVDITDATAVDQSCGLYVMGEFNSNVISAVMGASWTIPTLMAALPSGIFIKTALSGAPV